MKLPYLPRQHQLEKLVERLELSAESPIRWDLLNTALTHPTADAATNYEQLEFVGDAVIRIAVAEYLWETYPNRPVSEFAALRSILASDRVLAQIACSYGFDRYLIVAPSAAGDRAGYEKRMADALEAVVAALYLSTKTLGLVRPWLDPHWQQQAVAILSDPARQNYKAALQEWTQASYKTLPEYRVQEIRPLHGDPQRFAAEVWLQGRCLGKGQGRSIKAAEQAAAREAYFATRQ